MLVGVEMMLVAANMCRCVCVVVSASSFEAFTHGETKEECLSSFSDTLN